jgi:hypothetical protein
LVHHNRRKEREQMSRHDLPRYAGQNRPLGSWGKQVYEILETGLDVGITVHLLQISIRRLWNEGYSKFLVPELDESSGEMYTVGIRLIEFGNY